MKQIICICLIVFAVAVFATEADDKEWEDYQKIFNKYYDPFGGPERMELLFKKIVEVQDHNKKYKAGGVTLSKGINEFAEWKEDEFKQRQVRHASIERRKRDIDEEWQQYKNKFNKHYESGEDNRRKDLFVKSKAAVEEHNRKYDAGEVTYKQGLNHLSDQTVEERASLLGARSP